MVDAAVGAVVGTVVDAAVVGTVVDAAVVGTVVGTEVGAVVGTVVGNVVGIVVGAEVASAGFSLSFLQECRHTPSTTPKITIAATAMYMYNCSVFNLFISVFSTFLFYVGLTRRSIPPFSAEP